MRTLRLLVAALLALAPATPSLALDRLLSAPRIKDNGDVRLSDDLKIGQYQGGKFISQPDSVQIQGSGSTGDVSGMRVGNARVAGYVFNNTELASANILAAVVVRGGFAAPGDGGRATYTYSPTACSISGGDGGSQIPASAAGCWNIDWSSVRGEATIELFGGAVGRSTAQAGFITNPDAQPALQKALNTGRTVRLGPLSYKLGRAAVLTTPGQTVVGRGAALSTLVYFTDFDLSNGPGVLTFSPAVFATTRADAPDFADFRIKGFQPEVNPALTDAQQLASLVQVTCIDARGGYRASFKRLVITTCMRGIDLRGDTGQTIIDDLLGSNFLTDIEIDGSLDTTRVTKHHNFPTNVTANQGALARRTAVAIRSGRMDDLKVSDSMCIVAKQCLYFYQGAVRTLAADGYVSPGGITTASFSNYNFDIVTQGWQVDNGVVSFVGGYYASTSGGLQNNGVVNITGTSLMGVTSDRFFTLNAGILNINSTAAISDNNTDFTFIYQAGGQISFSNNNYGWNPTLSASTSKSKILVAGGSIVASGNTVQARGPGTQGGDAYFFKVVTDGNHVITGNSVPGWQNYRAPPIFGRYGENAWNAGGGFPTLAALTAARPASTTIGQSFLVGDAANVTYYGVAAGGGAGVGRVTSDGAAYRWY